MDDDIETRGLKLGHMARSYDRFSFTLARARRVLDAFAVGSGDRVLDVGCGTGTLAIQLAKAVGPDGYVAAADPAAAMVEVTRVKAEAAGCDVDCRVAAIEQLPFEDGAFDHVYSTLMMHHLPADIIRTGLAEVRRVLVPGGLCCIVDFSGLLAPMLGHKSAIARRLEAAGFSDVKSAGRHAVVIELVRGTRA